jgi:hypothetical protein
VKQKAARHVFTIEGKHIGYQLHRSALTPQPVVISHV